jgi:hypothetical protein
MSVLARIRPHAFLFFLFALVIATTGCFKTWTVIKSSGPPSALAGQTPIAVQFDTSHIVIGNKDQMTEQQWLDSREKDEHRANYTESVQNANAQFIEGLRQRSEGVEFVEGPAPAGSIQMTVSWIKWEEGMYAAVVAWASEATARVIFTRDGEVLDEIEVKTSEQAVLTNADPRARFRAIGKRLGGFTGNFLKSVGG